MDRYQEDGGINIYDPSTQKYEYLMVDENSNQSISRNCIKSFLKDNQADYGWEPIWEELM